MVILWEMVMDNILNTDYRYVVPEDENARINIEITSGEYSGTIFKYGDVKLDEAADGNVYLSFIYEIVETPLIKKQLEKDADFKNKIGDILTSIIELQTAEELGKKNEFTTDDIEESDL